MFDGWTCPITNSAKIANSSRSLFALRSAWMHDHSYGECSLYIVLSLAISFSHLVNRLVLLRC